MPQKKIKAWKIECEENKSTQNTLAMLYRKFVRKKTTIIRCFV